MRKIVGHQINTLIKGPDKLFVFVPSRFGIVMINFVYHESEFVIGMRGHIVPYLLNFGLTGGIKNHVFAGHESLFKGIEHGSPR